MSNANLDLTPPEYIKPPVRMPNTDWDKWIIDKQIETKKGK